MSREWKPGDVAMWEHGGLDDGRELVMKTNRGWAALDGPTSEILFGTVRPLVVIDPEDREAVERLIHNYRMQSGSLRDVDAWTNALREFADPKPPKPEEPMGLGAVVEAADGRKWVRDVEGVETDPKGGEWYSRGCSKTRRYADIDAVKVLSEGIR